VDPDDPEFREWAARKMAEILSLEAKERAAAESPSEELKEISDVVDYQLMPIMEAYGIPITKEELSKMFVEWFVRRAPPQDAEGGHGPQDGGGAAGLSPALIGGKAGSIIKPLFRIARVNTFAGLLRRTVKGTLVVAMLLPLVLLPAYFFLSTLPAPLLMFNSASSQSGGGGALTNVTLTLNPASPLIGLGQTQNYSLLTVNATGLGTAARIGLTAFAPEGMSFELSQTYVSSQQSVTSIPVVIRASPTLSPGPHSVTVEERMGSTARNQTFTIDVVPALVVMERLSFVPQILNVTEGTTVYWLNLDSTIGCCDPGYHNAVFGSGLNSSSPVLKRLGAWNFTFETPGEFYYLCSIHPFMAGEVVVTARP
jgi:plastocyanin